ncbi:MAG TPA: hemerythrin domain-containing protein [Candidatus Sulfotelmatobacter sp.]|jgi:hemerythrin-like domain-containing protein|nr:hemerythrin domain-containing protein [Candidatus Sulfotelmatobacter sp.]
MFGNTQIGTLLHEEHVRTIQALQGLEEYLLKQTSKRVPDAADPKVRELLEHLLSDVAFEVERHFGFEENHLFPVLISRGEGGIAAFLTEEHGSILPLAQELAETAGSALNGGGFTPESWKEFHRRGVELCEREIFHIQKEEMGLLAAISMFVDPDADAALAATYRELVAAS